MHCVAMGLKSRTVPHSSAKEYPHTFALLIAVSNCQGSASESVVRLP